MQRNTRMLGESRFLGEPRMQSTSRVYGDSRAFGDSRMPRDVRMLDSSSRVPGSGSRQLGGLRMQGTSRLYPEQNVHGDARMHPEPRMPGESRMYLDSTMVQDSGMCGSSEGSQDLRMYPESRMQGDIRLILDSGMQDELMYPEPRMRGEARMRATGNICDYNHRPVTELGPSFKETNVPPSHLRMKFQDELAEERGSRYPSQDGVQLKSGIPDLSRDSESGYGHVRKGMNLLLNVSKNLEPTARPHESSSHILTPSLTWVSGSHNLDEGRALGLPGAPQREKSLKAFDYLRTWRLKMNMPTDSFMVEREPPVASQQHNDKPVSSPHSYSQSDYGQNADPSSRVSRPSNAVDWNFSGSAFGGGSAVSDKFEKRFDEPRGGSHAEPLLKSFHGRDPDSQGQRSANEPNWKWGGDTTGGQNSNKKRNYDASTLEHKDDFSMMPSMLKAKRAKLSPSYAQISKGDYSDNFRDTSSQYRGLPQSRTPVCDEQFVEYQAQAGSSYCESPSDNPRNWKRSSPFPRKYSPNPGRLARSSFEAADPNRSSVQRSHSSEMRGPLQGGRSPPTSSRCSRGRSPAPVARGRASPPVRGRSPGPSARGRSPAPHPRGRSTSPARRGPPARERSPVRGRSPGPTGRERSLGHSARGRSPGPSARGRSPGPMSKGRYPGHVSRGRSPPRPARGRSPGHPVRGRSPGHPAKERAPGHPARGRSPDPYARGRLGPSARGRSPPVPNARGRSPGSSTRRSPGPSARGKSPKALSRGGSPGTGSRGRCPGPSSGGRTYGQPTRSPRPYVREKSPGPYAHGRSPGAREGASRSSARERSPPFEPDDKERPGIGRADRSPLFEEVSLSPRSNKFWSPTTKGFQGAGSPRSRSGRSPSPDALHRGCSPVSVQSAGNYGEDRSPLSHASYHSRRTPDEGRRDGRLQQQQQHRLHRRCSPVSPEGYSRLDARREPQQERRHGSDVGRASSSEVSHGRRSSEGGNRTRRRMPDESRKDPELWGSGDASSGKRQHEFRAGADRRGNADKIGDAKGGWTGGKGKESYSSQNGSRKAADVLKRYDDGEHSGTDRTVATAEGTLSREKSKQEEDDEDLRVQLLRLREKKVEEKLKQLEEESMETEFRLWKLEKSKTVPVEIQGKQDKTPWDKEDRHARRRISPLPMKRGRSPSPGRYRARSPRKHAGRKFGRY